MHIMDIREASQRERETERERERENIYAFNGQSDKSEREIEKHIICTFRKHQREKEKGQKKTCI